MKKTEIVVAGHICLDISPEFSFEENQKIETLFRPGRLVNTDGVSISAGGAVANTGFALARLGINIQPMANIGNDEFGALVSGIAMKETGCGVAQRDSVRTSYSVILAPPGVDRIILHDPAGNNEFTSDAINYDELAEAGYFHFGYPPLMKKIFDNGGTELLRIYQNAKKAGVVTSLDLSLPDVDSESGQVEWKSMIERVLPYVDVFMPSIEEILFMMDRKEYDRIIKVSAGDDFTKYLDFEKIQNLAKSLLSLGSAIVFIKCGSNGIYVRTADEKRMQRIGLSQWANQEIFQPTYHVEHFKSALAGGDTTVAGFLAGMIRGYSLEDCARIACQTGGLCCTTYDSVSGLQPLEDVVKLVNAQPKQNETTLPSKVMKYDESARMYKA